MTQLDRKDFMIDYQRQEADSLFIDLFGDAQSVPVVYSSSMGSVYKYDQQYADRHKLDTYFIANSFKDNKRSKDALMELNTLFLDIDAGKALSFTDGQNRYLSEQSVEHFKDRVFPAIMTRTILPSYVVETRNGFQVYWIINKKDRPLVDIDTWTGIQESIVQGIFADLSDKAARDVSRLLRHPGSTWFKTKKNIDCNGDVIQPFDCRIVFSSGIKYGFDKIKAAFPKSKMNTFKSPLRDFNPLVYNFPKEQEAILTAIQESKFEYFSEWVLPEGTAEKLKDRKTFGNYIKRTVDIQSFFAFTSDCFKCIFHDDKDPSARILPPRKGNNEYSYYCHGDGCQTNSNALSIFDMISRIRKCDFNEAVDFMAKCFGVEIRPTVIVKNYREVVKERTAVLKKLKTRVRNKQFLERVDVDRVHKVFNHLIRETAQTSGKTERVDLLYIPCAKRLLEKIAGADCHRMYLTTKFMAFIGFIKPISDHEVNMSVLDDTVKKLVEEQRSKYGDDKTMQFYKIEVWPDLKRAEKKIQERIDRWIKGGLDVKKITVESVARIYGEKTAGQLFPKCF